MNRCADASFLIDVTRADAGAAEKVREMRVSGEPIRSPAPAIAELLIGALVHRGKSQRLTFEFAQEIETLPTDFEVAAEAARIGVGLVRRGRALPMLDLLVAATARVNHLALLTRDTGFSHIEDLVLEEY